MDNKEKSPEKELIESIGLMIEKGMESNTNIYTGVVKSVDGKRAVVAVNGQNQNVSIATADVSSGNVVRVFVPEGNMSAAFIIKAETSGGGGPTTTAYGDLTGKPQINGVTLVDNKTSKELNLYGTGNEPPYPVTSVNGQTGAAILSAADVGALSNTTVIPDKTSQLDNDSGYITNSALTGYAKKTEIPTKTSQLTNDSGFITDAALTGYAKTTDIPTKTSQLDNDSHYITANEAPVTSVNNKTGAVQLNASDVGALPNTTVIPTKTSQLDNDSGFISDIPIASATQLGGVKIGAGLSITENGVLSATGGGTADAVEWNNVLDKPTTIAGYGITDAKIENGTITLGNQTITPLTSAPVTSVNSKTGDVVLTANDVGALPADTVIPTVNNATLTIRRNSVDVGSFTANSANDVNIDINVPTDKSDIGLGNVDNVKQYSASNPPPYPVTSVNGHTGAITVHEVPAVTASDNGKFLRVVNGAWAAATIADANGVKF